MQTTDIREKAWSYSQTIFKGPFPKLNEKSIYLVYFTAFVII